MEKNDIEAFIRKEIKKSGFPLEIKSALILRKLGWNAIPHTIFYNSLKNSNREIDLTAIKQIQDPRFTLAFSILVIECKKQEKKPWVFFEGDEVNTKVTSIIALSKERTYHYVRKHFEEHYYRRQKPCVFHFPAFVESGKPDVILEAINQVLDSLTFTYDQFSKGKIYGVFPTFFYPIIILDGRLFSAQVKPDGDIIVTETDYLQLWARKGLREPEEIEVADSSTISSFTKDIVIDIVRFDFLEKFLKFFP